MDLSVEAVRMSLPTSLLAPKHRAFTIDLSPVAPKVWGGTVTSWYHLFGTFCVCPFKLRLSMSSPWSSVADTQELQFRLGESCYWRYRPHYHSHTSQKTLQLSLYLSFGCDIQTIIMYVLYRQSIVHIWPWTSLALSLIGLVLKWCSLLCFPVSYAHSGPLVEGNERGHVRCIWLLFASQTHGSRPYKPFSASVANWLITKLWCKPVWTALPSHRIGTWGSHSDTVDFAVTLYAAELSRTLVLVLSQLLSLSPYCCINGGIM